MDKVRILYFLEDRAQEELITAIVCRVASEVGFPETSIEDRVLSGTKGLPQMYTKFKLFLKDVKKGNVACGDIVVVSRDGNCKRYKARIAELERYVSKHNARLAGRIVYAVPDPHIERWYIMDQGAIQGALGSSESVGIPSYKCDKKHYKGLLSKMLKRAGVQSLLGGYEYAGRIVSQIRDLNSFAANDEGCVFFLNELRSRFAEIAANSTQNP